MARLALRSVEDGKVKQLELDLEWSSNQYETLSRKHVVVTKELSSIREGMGDLTERIQ